MQNKTLLNKQRGINFALQSTDFQSIFSPQGTENITQRDLSYATAESQVLERNKPHKKEQLENKQKNG